MARGRVLAPALVVAFGGTLTAACNPPSAPAPPARIAFDMVTYDAGTVEPGTRLAHAYPFTNAGALPLVIDNIRPSCGCTATLNTARTLAPGGRATINLDCEPETAGGAQSHTVTVYSNDPVDPVRTLILTDHEQVMLEADPPQLYVGHLQRGQLVPQPLQWRGSGIADAGAITVSGRSIRTDRPDISGGAVHLSARPDAPLGPFTDRILVSSRSTQQTLRSVPVSGIVDGPVTISPARMYFGTVGAKARAARVVGIRAHGAQPPRITAVRLTPEIGAAVVDTVGDGAEYRVTVTLNEDLRPGKISAVLEIDTDNAEQPRLQVPCIGRVVEKS